MKMTDEEFATLIASMDAMVFHGERVAKLKQKYPSLEEACSAEQLAALDQKFISQMAENAGL